MTLAPGINYDTDQFVDPVTGYTVQDDGTNIYISPNNGIVYDKIRKFNGWYTDAGGGQHASYAITLAISTLNGYVTEDRSTFYSTEDGSAIYIPEP